jgi:hypothetical protein
MRFAKRCGEPTIRTVLRIRDKKPRVLFTDAPSATRTAQPKHCRTADDRPESFAHFYRCLHQVYFPLIATVKAEIVL